MSVWKTLATSHVLLYEEIPDSFFFFFFDFAALIPTIPLHLYRGAAAAGVPGGKWNSVGEAQCLLLRNPCESKLIQPDVCDYYPTEAGVPASKAPQQNRVWSTPSSCR
jgi:hypothetical protein